MDILVRPEELRRAAGQIHRSAKVIAGNVQQVDECLKALTPAHFEGLSANQLRRRYQARRDALQNAQAKANLFAENLETIAAEFEKKDRELQGGAAAGSVLGISTLSPAVESEAAIRVSYMNMRWAERFSTFGTLESEYQRLLRLVDPEKTASAKDQLREYDRLIAAEEARLAEARQGGDSFWNKVIPTFPLQGDGDGVPWRVKADDFEDAEAAAMQNLQVLRAKRNALQNEYDVMLANQNQLESVTQRRDVLNNLINEGVPPDGPTNAGLRALLGGCTHYVAEKR
ncbi:MAG: type VII secretion target, partial [Anaerolineaceae bacterium]